MQHDIAESSKPFQRGALDMCVTPTNLDFPEALGVLGKITRSTTARDFGGLTPSLLSFAAVGRLALARMHGR